MGHHFRNAFVAQPWKLQSCLIWLKNHFALSRADYHWIHEPILYGWKEGESHRWHGDRSQSTIMEYSPPHYDKANCDTEGTLQPGLIATEPELIGHHCTQPGKLYAKTETKMG